ncbi:MAG: TVP38/TMEM64 family protein [Pseudomonadota bacterium]
MTDTAAAMTADTPQTETPKGGSTIKRFAPLAVVVGGLAFAYSMGWHQYFSLEFLAESRDAMTAYVAENYATSLIGFTALYALAVAFSFPAASILTIFAGFLFGWFVGGLIVAVGATVGATAIFLVARSAFGDFLKEKVGGRVKNLAEGFEKEAFSYLLVLRLAPVFPFFIMNIAPALFNVPLRTYVIATLFGILPGTFAYTFLGEGVGSVLAAAEDAGTTVGVGDLVTTEITFAFVALAVVAAIPILIKRLRKTPAGEDAS